MNDHELLEKAALASRYEVWTDCDGKFYTGEPERLWQPIEDNADALQLLLTIKADVYHGENEYGEPIITIQPPYLSLSESPSALADSGSGIRRAIVRAAALADNA